MKMGVDSQVSEASLSHTPVYYHDQMRKYFSIGYLNSNSFCCFHEVLQPHVAFQKPKSPESIEQQDIKE